MRAASRRLQLAPAEKFVCRGNRRAAAGESDLDALTPERAPLPLPSAAEHLCISQFAAAPHLRRCDRRTDTMGPCDFCIRW